MMTKTVVFELPVEVDDDEDPEAEALDILHDAPAFDRADDLKAEMEIARVEDQE